MTAPANIVRACYVHDQGCEPGSWMEENVAPYMAWCEAKVNKWREALPGGRAMSGPWAEAFAKAHDDAVYVEARQQRRCTVWSAFDDVFQ